MLFCCATTANTCEHRCPLQIISPHHHLVIRHPNIHHLWLHLHIKYNSYTATDCNFSTPKLFYNHNVHAMIASVAHITEAHCPPWSTQQLNPFHLLYPCTSLSLFVACTTIRNAGSYCQPRQKHTDVSTHTDATQTNAAGTAAGGHHSQFRCLAGAKLAWIPAPRAYAHVWGIPAPLQCHY